MISTRSLTLVIWPVLAGIAMGAETQPPQRLISVAGTAVTRTVPDNVLWRISTLDTNQDHVRAKESSDKKLKAILAMRQELGIKPEDVQTGQLSIRREYNYDDRGNRVSFKHYAVSREVTMRQRDLTRFDEFLTKLVSNAEIEVSFSLESSRAPGIRMETRLNALKIARDKAEAMTKELGAKLGRVMTIEEYRPNAPPMFQQIANNSINFERGAAPPPTDNINGTLAPGAIEISISVFATFEIE